MGLYDYSLTGSGYEPDASNIDPTKKRLAAQMLRGDSQFAAQNQNADVQMRLAQEQRQQQEASDRAAADRQRQQDADSLRRLEDERRRRQEELSRSQAPAYQPQQSSSAGGMPAMAGMQQMMGGGGAGAGTAGGASTGAGGGASGAGGAMAGAAPWVGLAAAIGSHHMWAKNKGMHDNQDGLLGRALYKDADWYQPRLNDRVDGWGDEVKLASLGSSPIDLFKANTWSDAAEHAAKGGILGAAIKKLF